MTPLIPEPNSLRLGARATSRRRLTRRDRVQLGVRAAEGHELRVRAFFHDSTFNLNDFGTRLVAKDMAACVMSWAGRHAAR